MEVPQKVSKQRMRLWHALHDFCRQHGGAVVSVPGHKEMRIEVPKDSALTAKPNRNWIRAAPLQYHDADRSRAFTTVDVVAILMPGK